MEKKISNKKIGINLLLILVLTGLVLRLVFQGEDLGDLYRLVFSIDRAYLFLALLSSLLFIMGEAINLYGLMKTLGYRPRLLATIKYSFIGFFFSSITPSATGGQPMQIYEMTKDGLELSHSSLMLLLELMVYQLVSLAYALLGLAYFWRESFLAGSFFYLVVLGLGLNALGVGFFALLIFRPSLSQGLLALYGKILSWLRFMDQDRREASLEKMAAIIGDYNSSASFIRGHRLALLRLVLGTCFQLGASFSVAYFIYRALGYKSLAYGEVLLIQALIYIGSSFVPLPGSIGLTEKNSLLVFSFIYREEMIASATLLSRGIGFYNLVLLSGLVLLSYRLLGLRRILAKN